MTSNMRKEAELKKQLALLEQKLDMQNKLYSDAQGNFEQKKDQNSQKNHEIKEFTELVKELRKESKGLRGQLKVAQQHIKDLQSEQSVTQETSE